MFLIFRIKVRVRTYLKLLSMMQPPGPVDGNVTDLKKGETRTHRQHVLRKPYCDLDWICRMDGEMALNCFA